MKKILKDVLVLTVIALIYSCKDQKNVNDNPKIGYEPEAVEHQKPNYLQALSQKEKFLSLEFPMDSVILPNNEVVDLTKTMNIHLPEKTSKNFFLSSYINHYTESDFDNNGVLFKENKYHPTAIAKLALASAMSYKETNSKKAKTYFDNQLNWIRDNFESKKYYGTWFFPYEAPTYGLKKDWSSGYAHGLLLSALIEGYQISGDNIYKPLIEKAIKMYVVPQEFGGFKRSWESGEWWFEEYSTDKPSRVLNGKIFNLECIYNAYQDLKIPLLKKLFDGGTATLLNHLKDFDSNYSSRYNLADWKNEIALENYHEIHIIQMLWLHSVTNNDKFKIYAKKFLENDRYDFFRNSNYYFLPKKNKNITASSTIDSVNYGVNNLDRDIWAFGNFWSSYEKTDLIIDFGESKSNINGLTLYHATPESKDVKFELFRYDEELQEYIYVEKVNPKLNKDKISVYNKTGSYETYIEHFKIHEPLYGQKIKIIFYPNSNSVIALRNINFIYNRTEELDYLLKLVLNHKNKN